MNVYHSKETDFNHNGLCILDPIVTISTIAEEINGQFSLELEVTKDTDGKYKYITEFCIIKADGQLFRLYNQSNVQDRGLTIKATLYHISNDINTDFLEEVYVEDGTAYDALRLIILDTRFVVQPTDISTTNTMTFLKDKPTNALFKTIIPGYNGELYRDNFKIGVVSRIGTDTGLSIEYAKNITGFEQVLDYSGIVTKMLPTGKDGATIDLINNGDKWIYSPRINQYFKVFTSEVPFTDLEDATEIKTAGESLWGSIDVPKANYRVSFIELKNTVEYKDIYKNMEYLKLGDGVVIRHRVFNVDLTARVIKMTKDALTGKTLEIELGEFRDNIFNTLDGLNYKVSSVNTSLEAAKKDLYTKVTQTDERITLEAVRLDGDIADTRSRIDISASEIRLEVSQSNTAQDGRINDAFAAIKINSDNINLKVTKDKIISEINLSPEGIKITADKIELSGYAKFTNLVNAGETSINGANIVTGTLSFGSLSDKPFIPTQYTDDMVITKIRNTYINADGVWTNKIFADNIQAGTIKSVNLESSSLKLTGGDIILEPINKYYSSGSQVPLTFRTYANMSIETTGILKYWAGMFWFDKNVNVPSLTTTGEVACNSLKVNGTTITGNAVVAKFG